MQNTDDETTYKVIEKTHDQAGFLKFYFFLNSQTLSLHIFPTTGAFGYRKVIIFGGSRYGIT